MTISKLYMTVSSALSNKRGAAMVEYALLAGLVAIVAMTTLSMVGTSVKTQFSTISTSL